jgi:hypothetical protein
MAAPASADASVGQHRGEARLRCTVRPDRVLTHCTLVEEAPKGMGFGAAGLRMAKAGRLEAPQPQPGVKPQHVLTIRISIRNRDDDGG